MTGIKLKPFWVAAVLACVALSSAAPARTSADRRWVAAWASAQMLVDEQNATPPAALHDVTLRQLVRTSLGGTRIRLRVSNAFGTSPLTISGVNVARAISPDSSRIHPGTQRQLTFAGQTGITIPAGADYLSDPVDMPVPALSTLAVSMHFPDLPRLQTGHPGSRAASYLVGGDQREAAEFETPTRIDHWYYLSELDVAAEAPSAAIAVLGDSITDGYGVKPNTNSRWTDFLLERLKSSAATRNLGVVNLGIGGNRLVDDGTGPNAVARFGRDVLARKGIRYLIILEGANDLGMLTRDRPASPAEHRALVQRLIGAYAQMVERARQRGIKVIGATVMPYGGSAYYHPDAANEADRQAINRWIRSPGHVDAIIDFDALMRDPAQPDRLRKKYDSGDGLHPSIAGYRMMGDSVPLSLFWGRNSR